MKKFFVVLTLLVLSQVALGNLAFIGVDGVETTYSVTPGELLMDGSGLVIILGNDDNTQSSLIGSFALNSTRTAGTNFAGGSFAFKDASTAVIISGDVVGIDFMPFMGVLAGSGSVSITVDNLVAGDLLGNADLVGLTFNITPSFTDFDSNFEGLSKVNVLVPEPATMALLGLGGLLLRRKRKA